MTEVRRFGLTQLSDDDGSSTRRVKYVALAEHEQKANTR